MLAASTRPAHRSPPSSRSTTTSRTASTFPAVAAAADGRFIVAWSSYLQDGANFGIFARRFNAAGQPQAVEFQVNTRTTNFQNDAAVAIEPDGDFVVAWQSFGQDDITYGIFAKRFDSAGVPQARELQVNTYTTGNQVQASVAIGADGRFVVAWTSGGQDGDDVGVFARRFDSAGAPQATELQVNTYTTSSQHRPSAAFGDAGGFVVAWQSFLQDGDADGIFARTLQRERSASGRPSSRSTPPRRAFSDTPARPQVDGQFVVTWQSFGPGRLVLAASSPDASPPRGVRPGIGVPGEHLRHWRADPSCSGREATTATSPWPGRASRTAPAPASSLGAYEASRAGDIDGNGVVAPLTDGILLLRYLFGFRGATLTTGALGPNCTRCTATAIESYIAAKV